jgi:hypothetical protein
MANNNRDRAVELTTVEVKSTTKAIQLLDMGPL